uniref:Peptidase C1A papain C-terminal domain-containing protein n=1 Tax=Alexandrium catenella TaxID=2925 RepID=A0A7S1RI40_ALECA|mmetsp:Transcript_59308/g.158823  ORF Transcript_59308/g.158823 Transcript_59308/m.158823 type:complete len:513 (+) Transcript_59308:40-1578(+)
MAVRCGCWALLAGLALTSLAAPVAEDAAECTAESSAESCAIDGGLAVDSAERDGSLNMLQRRGLKLQEQQDVAQRPAGAPEGIDWDSSHHGNGPIWKHWQRVAKNCNTTVVTRKCRRALAGTATRVFMLLKHMENHNYTHTEIRHFRRRFSDLLKQNSTVIQDVTAAIAEYPKWKEAVFHIYELMRPAVTRQLVDEVNRQKLGWTAHYRESMAQDSLMSVIGLTGLELTDSEAVALFEETKRAEPEDLLQMSKSPEAMGSFDARDRWPECGSVLRHVRYQDCQNCWSHATALVTESRVCIASRGKLNGRDAWLSQSFIAMCRPDRKDYCAGASGSLGFLTVNTFGVPTGAPNSRGNAPTGIRTCVPQAKPNLEGLRCPATCTEYEYPRSLESDLFYPRFSPRSLSPRGSATLYMAKQSILEEGPILFGMTVFSDFWSYHSGIYVPSKSHSNRNMGGHAVTGMGFGENYFLCVNSWGPHWGMAGSFQVAPQALNLVVVLPGFVRDSSFPTPVP